MNPPAGEGESYDAMIESEIHRCYCLNELLTGKRFGEASCLVFPMLVSHAHRQVIVSLGWIELRARLDMEAVTDLRREPLPVISPRLKLLIITCQSA